MNEILKTIAPGFVSMLAGPFAGAAMAFLASKLGVPVDKVQETVSGMTPADLVRMKELDYDFQKFMATNAQALNLAQIEVNKTEATSTNWFVSGWRPAAGWVCVAALALTYIPKALVMTGFWGYQAYLILNNPAATLPTIPPFPDLGITDLIGLLLSMLGMAGLRSIDKAKGNA